MCAMIADDYASALDPSDAPGGHIAVKMVDGCQGCAFEYSKGVCSGYCTSLIRPDGSNVIFRKIGGLE